MKKIFSILWWIGFLALSTISCTFAYTQEQHDAYQWAYKYGITTQPTIEAANLDWNLTRQAFAKMVVNYLENAAWVKENIWSSCYFKDENKFTNELKSYAKKTCAYQIMWSNWANFNPTNPVNRAQLWTVLSRILWWSEYDTNEKNYYVRHLNALKFNRIMNRIDNPQTYAKRWDVLIMLKRIYEKYGSNISMNGNKISAYNTIMDNKKDNKFDDNNSNIKVVNAKPDKNGFMYYDSYLDRPTLSNAMKDMKLRSTNCSNIFCQQVGDDGTYSNQKHYYWNDKEWTMTLIPWVYYVSDCEYYDEIYGSNNNTVEYDNSSDYITTLYENSNVIYTWKDGTKYVYDDNFLNVLMNTAKEKWENDLYKFLEVETSYYKNGLDEIANLDMDELAEMLGIDEDLDPDSLTAKEKEELLNKFKEGLNKLIKDNKNRNEDYLDKLEKVTKNVSSNDKFWLKDKYKKTKWFIDATISFLDLYTETILNLLELSLTSEDWEIDDWEWMAVAFTLIWTALAYQGEAQNYQSYIEEWATDTIKLLWWELNTDNVKYNERKSNSNSNSKMSAAETRARDVSRKNDLSQIQTAIITSQADKWVWPGMDKWATKWIPTSNIEKELMYAWMASVPTDPISSNINYWLWENNTVKWDYLYVVAKRNWVKNWWFVVMSKQELAWSSNRIVCENKSWLDNWYITNDTDLKEVTPCKDIKEWNSCSAKACTYTSNEQLRYILIY